MISPTINIGPLTIHYYGIIIASATFIGWALAKSRAPRYKIPQEIFDEPQILLVIGLALVGARIYHVLDYWKYYIPNPISIFYITNGGIGIWGALFGGLIGLYLFTKLKKIPLLAALDLISPSLILAQAIGRFGNYINQEGFGLPTDLPWGVYIDPSKRPLGYLTYSHFQPTFFYEAALDFLIFAILIYFSRRTKAPGRIFAFYLIFYSSSRFFIEFLRIDTWTVGTVKIAQVIAILTFFFGLNLLLNPKKSS